MRQSLLIYTVFKGVNSVAGRYHIQHFEVRLCLRTHSSHGAARRVCFSGPAGDSSKIPVSPPPTSGLHRVQTFALQGSFHPGSAAGRSSLTLALIVVPLVLAERLAFPLKPAKRPRHQHDSRVAGNADICNKHLLI